MPEVCARWPAASRPPAPGLLPDMSAFGVERSWDHQGQERRGPNRRDKEDIEIRQRCRLPIAEVCDSCSAMHRGRTDRHFWGKKAPANCSTLVTAGLDSSSCAFGRSVWNFSLRSRTVCARGRADAPPSFRSRPAAHRRPPHRRRDRGKCRHVQRREQQPRPDDDDHPRPDGIQGPISRFIRDIQ